MPKNNDIEEILLSNASIDDLIKQKIDSEISQEIAQAKKAKHINNIKDFKKLPEENIFSKKTTYIVFNRSTKQESHINGVQAECLIGIQSHLREKLIQKQTDCFLTDNYYVKFYCAELNSAEIE